MNKPYYTVPEIADMLGVHPQTVRNAITGRAGKYPKTLEAIFINSNYLVKSEDVEAFVADYRRKQALKKQGTRDHDREAVARASVRPTEEGTEIL